MQVRLKRLIPNASMAVALLALFVALTGSAYAGVKLSKNSVTTKTIKNGAVTGKKIKKQTITSTNIKSNTITGKQINEAKLGPVPSASSLVGFDPKTKVDNSQFVTFNVASNRGDAPKTLATFGPWTLVGRCEVSGVNSTAAIDVVTSKAGTYTPYGSDTPVGTYPDWIGISDFAPTAQYYTTNEPRFLDPQTGMSALDGDGQPAGIWVGFPGADCRFVGKFPVTMP